MGTTASNVAYKETVFVSEFDGVSPYEGLPSSGFSFQFLKDGVSETSVSTQVQELSGGMYELSITFPSEGFWVTTVEVSNGVETIHTFILNTNVRDADTGSDVYSSGLSGSVAMTQTIGGLSSGTTVASLSNGTKTVSQVLDQLLFPTAYPTVTSPSVSLGDNIDNLQIVGDSVDFTLTTSANRGTINTSWDPGSQGAYAGDVTAAYYSYDGVNTTINVGPGSTDIDNAQISNHTVVVGSNSWTLVATFAAGVEPRDSTGAVVTPSQAFTGGTRNNSTSFEGVYPIFLRQSAGNFTQRSLVSHNANNIQCSQNYPETVSSRHAIQIPDAMISGRSVILQQWNTVSSSYANATAQFSSTPVSVSVQGSNVSYTQFTKVGDPGGGDVGGQPLYRVRF